MIGIIGAMEPEVKALQQKLEHPTVTTISGIDFYAGHLFGKEVVVAQCGVGKVFAALCAQTMILQFHVDCVLNTGVAGSLSPAVGVLDIAIANQVVQHDIDTTPLGDPKGLISGINLVYLPTDECVIAALQTASDVSTKVGTIASGDQFLADPAVKAEIKKTFHAIACEMEGAAIGQVCHVNKVPFGVVRVISDSATGDGAMEYTEFLPKAAQRSTQLVGEFIKAYEV